MEINCEFSEPLFLGTDPDPTKDEWEFSAMTCGIEDQFQVISDGENSFNLYPSISYAEVVIISFLIFFLFLKIFGAIWNFGHDFIIRQKWLR